MKKKVLFAVALVFAICCFCGCALGTKGKLETETNRLMKGIQNYDEEIVGQIKEKSSENDIEDESEEPTDDEEDVKFSEAVDTYLLDCCKQMKYEIKEIDTEKMTVKVECTYVDGTDVMSDFYSSIVSKALITAFDDNVDEIDDAQMAKEFKKAVAVVEKPEFSNEVIILKFKKDGSNYKLETGYDELLKVMTANISEYFNGDNDENNEKLAENIEYTVENTVSGAAIFVTNNNKEAVSVTFDVLFNDESGAMVEDATESIDYIAPGETQFVGVNAFSPYASSDVQMKVYETYFDVSDDIGIEDNISNLGVMAKVTNNGKKELSRIQASAVFYDGDAVVGFSRGYEYEVKPGEYASIELLDPYDKENYCDIEYQNYSLYVQAYK